MNAFTRVTKSKPCPRCASSTWCLISKDGAACLCMRDMGDRVGELKDGTPYGFHWTGAPGSFVAYDHKQEPDIAPPEARDRAYRALLDALPLTEQHRQHLRHRGLSPDQTEALYLAGYRSLPDHPGRKGAISAAMSALSASGGLDATSLPGLYRGKDAWRLAGKPGLLIPVRDHLARVIALKIRPDEPGEGGKYVWMSANGHGGSGPGARCHIARATSDTGALRIVEGVLKADIVAALDPSHAVLGLPSCNAISTAIVALRALAPTRVLLAWDGDARENIHVANGLARAISVTRETLPGVSLAVEMWDRAHKGLDDAIAAGAEITVREDADAAAAEMRPELAPAAPAASSAPAPATPPSRALTDLGNAERIADAFRDQLRWVDGLEWLTWDGRRWRRDTSYEAQRIAVAAIRAIPTEATTHPDGEKAVIRHALKSESANGIASALKLLRGIPGMAHPVGDFDRDPWLLNCENGTLDLRTATLRPHAQSDLITKLAPVAWDPCAGSGELDAFLARVQPDAGTRAYLQRFIGYAATGVIREHVFPIWYGSGRNGKGTLTDAVRAALGDYATDVPAEMLTVRKNDAHPTERMCLLGARFASASETESNTALAVAFVKRATGGDPITARYLGKDFVTFDPTHKIALSTNNRPRIREGSDAIWRRVHLVPWEVQIPEAEVDASLRDRLRDEHRAAVLRWIVDGCLAWQRQGLAPPEKVVAATRMYREDSEPDVAAFLRERCVIEADARVARKDLLAAMNAWLAEDGAESISAKYLGDYLAEHGGGMGVRRTSYGPVKVFKGLRLKTPGEVTADAFEPDHRAQETSGSSIGLKTQTPVKTDTIPAFEPDEPDDMHVLAYSAQAQARAARPGGAPDLQPIGLIGLKGSNHPESRGFFMSPIENADRAQSPGARENAGSREYLEPADPLDDGNGHLWADP